MKAWIYNEDSKDPREPNQQSPNIQVTEDELSELGVLYWKFDVSGSDFISRIDELCESRNYKNRDQVTISKETMPNYEEKLKTFFTEHLHDDEEIRLILEGSGYFDVRNNRDQWIRINTTVGDMIVLPAGIYHRFTLDSGNYIKAMRLFKEDPKWTPINRESIEGNAVDANLARMEYLSFVKGNGKHLSLEFRKYSLMSSLTSFGATRHSLVIDVSEPMKHGDGSTAFVTYLVHYSTILDQYSTTEASVRRRFQDFVWLSKCLAQEHPACILPPLPQKHRIEYITGDRFSPEFIEKRRCSLENYIQHVARHPILQGSVSLCRFLETSDIQIVEHTVVKQESRVFENIGDAILNAFSKVRKPDPKFIEIKTTIEKFQQTLAGIEKSHSKLLKIQSDLSTQIKQFGDALISLSSIETQMTIPLSSIGTRLENYATFIKDKVLRDELEYAVNLRDYVDYCDSVKECLKLRDQKQCDHEELSGWYASYITERDRTAGGRASSGITGFFKDKINDFKGVDPEKARQTRVTKLSAKIVQLEEAVSQSEKDAASFSEQVEKEIEIFQNFKTLDFKEYLSSFSGIQMEFHEKGLLFWDSIIPMVNDLDLVVIEQETNALTMNCE